MRRVVTVLIAALLFAAVPATSPASAAAGTASVVFVHGAVDSSPVDVYVDGSKVLDDVDPSTASGALQVDAGVRTIAITGSSDSGDSPLLLTTRATLVAGADVSIVSHLNETGNPVLSTFRNDTSVLEPGDGRLTIRHLAGAASVIDIAIDGDFASRTGNLTYGTSNVAVMRTRSYDVRLDGDDSETVRLGSGENVVVYAVDDPGAGLVDLLTQTVAAPGAPVTLNIIHAMPGSTVDVYLDGLRVLAGLDAGVVAGPRLIKAGSHDIEVFSAGEPYAAGNGLISADNIAMATGADLSMVAHLSADSVPEPSLTIYVDDLTPIPDDRANLIVRHVADAPAVDVATGASVLLDGIEHRQSPGVQVAAGSYPISVMLDSDGSVVAEHDALLLEAGTNTVVYAFGSVGGSTLEFTTHVTGGLARAGAFPDAGSAFYTDHVRAIFQLDITHGSNGVFQPNRPVSRGEMAALLNRALNLPASTVDAFDDDDGNPFEADINAIAAVGITTGTSATTYSPSATVTRAQVAGFLVRAFNIPVSGADFFVDDDGHGLEAEINALADTGITKGTSETTYAPELVVTRGEVASFLARSLGFD